MVKDKTHERGDSDDLWWNIQSAWWRAGHAHRRLSYLDGVAVDRLSSAGDVHRFGDLQDVVWHVAGRPTAVTNLPPLLPVVQNLTDQKRGLDTIQFWFSSSAAVSSTMSSIRDKTNVFICKLVINQFEQVNQWSILILKSPIILQTRNKIIFLTFNE